MIYLTLTLILFLFWMTCFCLPAQVSSDFNVILPEICYSNLNLTWIEGMVRLGIREEQAEEAHHKLNLWSREEICDGSDGLVKFFAVGERSNVKGQKYQGRMIASLPQTLCPSAAAFSKLNNLQFVSWTCSQTAGVQSMGPEISDVAIAVERMLKYKNFNRVAFTKSKIDRSPFCEKLGAYLSSKNNSNFPNGIRVLGNYEDLQENGMLLSNLDGLFLCLSYDIGFTHNLSVPTGQYPVPTILLPQWPLPVELFSPTTPTLALVADIHQTSKTTTSFDFQQKNWEPLHSSGESLSSNKLLETLLAQMVVKSVKLSSFEDVERKEDFHHAGRHNNGAKPHDHETNPKSQHQFLFSVLQFEKARWHPLINLVNGERERHHQPKVPSGIGGQSRIQTIAQSTSKGTNGKDGVVKRGKTYYMSTGTQILVGCIFILVMGLGTGFFLVYCRRRTRRRNFSSAKHCRKLSKRHRVPGTSSCKLILTENDLTFGGSPAESKKGSKSPFMGNLGIIQRSGSQEKDRPDLLKGSFGGIRKQSSVNNIKGEVIPMTEGMAKFKGEVVHLKMLHMPPETHQLKMKSIIVLETIRGVHHENMVSLIGCFLPTTETGPYSYPSLVYEYCSRGSLHDLILKKDIKMDWTFKLSLLSDLVRGMRYLHNSVIRVHGYLNSKNCVVDGRWTLKLKDYSLPAFYYAEGLSVPTRSAKALLWTAPELLRDETLRSQGTQAADVYAFAIIMQEVLIRGEPFCMLALSPEEILEKVKHPPPLIRPSVSKGIAPPEAINIMRQCWTEFPEMRPDFGVINDLFKTLNHERKANIVDTMFQMLEKYSNNLEELVQERTEQLNLEKMKTENLLNRMLPSTVAEKLKVGQPVDPEEFGEVTIYFSDIVGFTTISAHSTPIEVVDLLNDLYTAFDATINDYNVYKVETIGDAYMVVGGAPLWCPDHADQIAMMALDLLHQSGKFKIRHLPYTPLRLRIGLHTGSVCAGVVGLTMPRYCLFGDTVNTASRMESTGAPWRIHISDETKAKLDQAGGYIIEARGMTDIKGKGKMPTYWLLGKEGFDKDLPKPPGLDECHRLDEKAIKYGRTGVWPKDDDSSGSGLVKIQVDTSSPVGASVTPVGRRSPKFLAPPKSPSSFAMLQGGDGNVRSLSPAEQIAHQLLNGRQPSKGLRRQLSLDHRAMPAFIRRSHQQLRRAPSLEKIDVTSCSSETLPIPINPVITVTNTTTGNNSDSSTSPCPFPMSPTPSPSPPRTPSPNPSKPEMMSTSLPTTSMSSFLNEIVIPQRDLTDYLQKGVLPEESLEKENILNSTSPLPPKEIVKASMTKPTPNSNSFMNEVVIHAKDLANSPLGVSVKDLSGDGTGTTSNRVKLNKLSKVLSVVEEGNGNDSPTMDRKYEVVFNSKV